MFEFNIHIYLYFIVSLLCILINCEECELKKVLHEFQLPGCVKKVIPTYGCQGVCSSYVQVSSSKFWELERSCTCCQDMGQKERTVTVECPERPTNEIQVIIRAPLSCICRQCTDINENLVRPQEFKNYPNFYQNELEESIAFI